ncbi:MAG TPA: hypothetical protein VGO46_05285 [Gemmatimonadaceae bacterium]|nr:hypothetical protein [Gemmatimonadaceae bacterium]
MSYGRACDIYSSRMGMSYGSRIGWIGTDDLCQSVSITDSMTRVAIGFPLHSSDAFLFSDSLASRMERLSDVDESWRTFLLRNPSTPFDVIVREVRRDPHRFALVALDNPAVTRDTIPFEKRLTLAMLEDTLAMSAVWLPSVRDDPERLARVADLPMYRSPGRGVELVHERMRRLMPSLSKSAWTLSERAALHVYMAQAMVVTWGTDTVRASLVRGLSPSEHRVILALNALLRGTPAATDIVYAQESLRRLGSTPERELLEAVRRIKANELPASLPSFLLSGAIRLPWTVLDAVSRLDERFRYVRAQAALALAAEHATPDSVLLVLARGLGSHRDPALAERLLERAIADTSHTLLLAIADLDSVRYGTVTVRARERLAKLDPAALAGREPRRRPRGVQPTPAISDSAFNESWISADQCLAADEWSEQLRLAIGDSARLLAGHMLCIRAAAALNSAFELPAAYDSAYVFRVPNGYEVALPPKRADADVTMVRFDSALVERSRRTVRIH